jgi:hypothetical protein
VLQFDSVDRNDPETAELIRQHYRWWTCSVGFGQIGGGWLKIGPIAFAWYPWVTGRWIYEAHLLHRWCVRSSEL